MTKDMVSPNAAVKITGISRSSIMRALADKTLFSRRDNRNRWLIARSDLTKWAADRPDTLAQFRIETRTAPDSPETLIRLAVAEARLADVMADRDRLARLLDIAVRGRPGILSRIMSSISYRPKKPYNPGS